MYAYSLLNISYGERKNMSKKGEQLTASMKFQKGITYMEDSSSQGKTPVTSVMESVLWSFS